MLPCGTRFTGGSGRRRFLNPSPPRRRNPTIQRDPLLRVIPVRIPDLQVGPAMRALTVVSSKYRGLHQHRSITTNLRTRIRPPAMRSRAA